MKNLPRIISCLSVLLLWPAAAFAEVHVYSSIPLVGTEEVPPLTSNDNFGTFTGIYDDETDTFYYSFSWSLESSATAAHFHGPADRGENASVLIGLGPVSGQTGTTEGSVMLTDEQETQMLDGLWYVNVHSENHAPGAIRGQVKELPPGATSTTYNTESGELNLHAVTVPRLGVFEVQMNLIEDRSPLSLEIVGPAELKDLDAHSSNGDSDEGDPDGSDPDPGPIPDPY